MYYNCQTQTCPVPLWLNGDCVSFQLSASSSLETSGGKVVTDFTLHRREFCICTNWPRYAFSRAIQLWNGWKWICLCV